MTERKSYGQFCALARSLDRVGDRWALLVIRELLLGGRTFRDLERALDGIGPSQLTRRLSALADDGLVVRNDAPRRSRDVEYRLTDAGRDLEAVVLELIRWGSRWMLQGPGDDRVDPRSAPLALRALLDGQPSRRGRLHLDIDGVGVTVESRAGRRAVIAGRRGRPSATVTAPLPTILAVAARALRLEDSDAAVDGDEEVAVDLLTPAAIAGG